MDAFITAIIKALPDAIATAIVTVLLAGGILFIFQKKIENSFAKSLFEHQTKFSKTYKDRMETLENLYQKFTIYKVDFSHMVEEASKLGYFPEKFSTTVSTMIMENRRKYEEFRTYFASNRLYLSDNTCTEIHHLLARHDLMDMAIYMFFDDIPEGFIKVGNNAIKALNFEVDSKSDFERPDFLSLILQTEKEVQSQAETLERLYKSVAEAQ